MYWSTIRVVAVRPQCRSPTFQRKVRCVLIVQLEVLMNDKKVVDKINPVAVTFTKLRVTSPLPYIIHLAFDHFAEPLSLILIPHWNFLPKVLVFWPELVDDKVTFWPVMSPNLACPPDHLPIYRWIWNPDAYKMPKVRFSHPYSSAMTLVVVSFIKFGHYDGCN